MNFPLIQRATCSSGNVPTTPPESGPVAPFYIVAGQSNTGRCTVANMSSGEAAGYDNERERTYILNPYASAINFSKLNPGTNTLIGFAGEFGFETSFSLLNEEIEEGNTYIVKYGVGNTAIDFWMSGLGENLKQYIRNAVIRITDLGKTPMLLGFLWMQGENDATEEAKADSYETNLGLFFGEFNDFFTALCEEFELPSWLDYKKIIGRINGIDDPSEVYRDAVRAAQASFCSNPSNNATLIDTDSYPMLDYVHYSATGQIQFGIDIFNALNP